MDTNFNYEQFKEKLEQEHTFPSVYMFKFIIPADNKKLALVEALFAEEADIHQKESSNRKYISITSKQVVMSSDEIIDVYKKAATIEGVMAL